MNQHLKTYWTAYWHVFHFLCSIALALFLWHDFQERWNRDEYFRCHNEMMRAFKAKDMPSVIVWDQKQKAAFEKAFGFPLEYIQ